MTGRIVYTDETGTVGVVYYDDGAFYGPIPPEDPDNLAIYERLIADGVVPEAFVPPPPVVRSASAYTLLSALTDPQWVNWKAARDSDRALMLSRPDAYPENDPVIVRVAGVLGTTPKAWFDAAGVQA